MSARDIVLKLFGGASTEEDEAGQPTGILSENVRQWQPLVSSAVAQYPNVDENFALGVMQAESAGNPDAASPAGAMGLFQFMDSTAKEYGVKNRRDPNEIIPAGVKKLSDLLTRYSGDKKKALAAYNGGESGVDQAVDKYGDAWLDHLHEFKGTNPRTGKNHAEETRGYINTISSIVPLQKMSAADILKNVGLIEPEEEEPIQPSLDVEAAMANLPDRAPELPSYMRGAAKAPVAKASEPPYITDGVEPPEGDQPKPGNIPLDLSGYGVDPSLQKPDFAALNAPKPSAATIAKISGKAAMGGYAALGKFVGDAGSLVPEGSALFYKAIGLVPGKVGEWGDRMAESSKEVAKRLREEGKEAVEFWQWSPEEQKAFEDGGLPASFAVGGAQLAALLPQLIATGGEAQAAKLVQAFAGKYGKDGLMRAMPILSKESQHLAGSIIGMGEVEAAHGEAEGGVPGMINRGLRGMTMGAIFPGSSALAGAVTKGAAPVVRNLAGRTAQAVAGGGITAAEGGKAKDIITAVGLGAALPPGMKRSVQPKTKGVEDAGTIRGDEGPVPEGWSLGEGGEAQGRTDIQRYEEAGRAEPTPRGEEPVRKVEEPIDQSLMETKLLPAIENPAERRVDIAKRKRIEEMTPEEAKNALMYDELTGMKTRRAWEDEPKTAEQGIIDVDGLKWANDNMGYEAGDELLKSVGNALKKADIDVFRIGGDEIRFQGEKAEILENKLKKAYNILNETTIDATLPDGTIVRWKGPGFSYGIAKSESLSPQHVEFAEQRSVDLLHEHKQQREQQGLRAGRAAEPPGVSRIPAKRNEDSGGIQRGQQSAVTPVRSTVPQEAPSDRRGIPEKAQEEAGAQFREVPLYYSRDLTEAIARIPDEEYSKLTDPSEFEFDIAEYPPEVLNELMRVRTQNERAMAEEAKLQKKENVELSLEDLKQIPGGNLPAEDRLSPQRQDLYERLSKLEQDDFNLDSGERIFTNLAASMGYKPGQMALDEVNQVLKTAQEMRQKLSGKGTYGSGPAKKKAEAGPNLFSSETGTIPGLEDTRKPYEIEQARREAERKAKRRENPMEGTMFDAAEMEARATEQGDMFEAENIIPFPKRGEGLRSQTGAAGAEEPARVKITANRPGTAEAEAMFEKQRSDVKAHYRRTFRDFWDDLGAKVVDVSYGAKRRLLSDPKAQARAVVMEYDKIKGANSEATAQLRDAEKAIFQGIPRKYDQLFGDFLQAKRTIEVEGLKTPEGESRNIQSTGGIGAGKLKDWLADLKDQDPQGYEAMEQASQRYYETMFKQLDQLADNGLLSADVAADLKANHRNYSPRKFIQHIDPDASTVDNAGRTVNAPDSGIKSLQEGSDQAMINNPRYLMAEVIARTQSRIAKNRANAALYKYIAENEGNALGGKVLAKKPESKADLLSRADNLGGEKTKLQEKLRMPMTQEEYISLLDKKSGIENEIQKIRRKTKTSGPGKASDNILSLMKEKVQTEIKIFEANKIAKNPKKLSESDKIELENLSSKIDALEARKAKGFKFEVDKLVNEIDAIDEKIKGIISPEIPKEFISRLSRLNRGIRREQPIAKLESDIWTIDEKIKNPLDDIQKRDIQEKISSIDEKITQINDQIKEVEKRGEAERPNELFGDQAPAGSRLFTAWENGEKRNFILPRQIAKYWVTSDPQISKMTATVLDYGLGGKILRPMATGFNPEFAIANLPRDMFHSWVATREYSSFLPVAIAQQVKDIIKVAPDAIRRKGRLRQYTKEGGGMEFLTQQGYVDRSRPWETPSASAEGFKQVQGVLGYLGETSEILMRLAIRERAIKNGKSPEEATWIARNYIDFSQGGSMAKAVDRAVPYLNASIQGTRGVVRAFREDPKRAIFQVAQLIAVGAGLALTNSSVRKNVWDEISEREKESKFIITLPWKYTDEDGAERQAYIGIAKDQGQRAFATIGEVMADRFMGNIDGKTAFERVKSATGDFFPVDPGNILPPAVSAFIGYINNKDFWTREEFWKGPDVGPSDEYWKSTPKIYKDIGQATGLSPERLKGATGKILPKNIYTDLMQAGWEEMTKDISKQEREKLDKTALEYAANLPGARRILRVTNPKSKEAAAAATGKEARRESNRKSLDLYDRATEHVSQFKERTEARSSYSEFFKQERESAKQRGEKVNRAQIKRAYDKAMSMKFLNAREKSIYRAPTVAEREAIVEKTLNEKGLAGEAREKEKRRLMSRRRLLQSGGTNTTKPSVF